MATGMYCSFVWTKVKGSLVWRKDLTSNYFISSFPITRTPSCGYRNTRNSHIPGLMHCKFKFIDYPWYNQRRAVGWCARSCRLSSTRLGQGQVFQRSKVGQGQLWRPDHLPMARRMLFMVVLHLDACWGRTGSNRCSMKLVGMKLTGLVFLFTMFELAGWGQIPAALCELGKEGRRHII